MLTRRQVLGGAVAAAVCATLPAFAAPEPIRLPLYRGFNLLEKFTPRNQPFSEADFEIMADWGFNFARLPMTYWCWSAQEKLTEFNEKMLKEIDQAIEFGRRHRIHVNLNFHRIPGYCVNPPKEAVVLWDDSRMQEVAALHWATFARRYAGIPSSELSFDLINEPPDIPEEKYAKVVRLLVETIRQEDPRRLIFADGLRWGGLPVMSIAGLGLVQSTRGYAPMQVSHHKARWVEKADTWPTPTWPLKISETDSWDKARLIKDRILPWREAEKKGVAVHVGEWGAHNRTPHHVTLAWMADCLSLWKEAGWGWALWNLRGSFGVMDSGRSDVQYESFKEHRLDRKMIELLRA